MRVLYQFRHSSMQIDHTTQREPVLQGPLALKALLEEQATWIAAVHIGRYRV